MYAIFHLYWLVCHILLTVCISGVCISRVAREKCAAAADLAIQTKRLMSTHSSTNTTVPTTTVQYCCPVLSTTFPTTAVHYCLHYCPNYCQILSSTPLLWILMHCRPLFRNPALALSWIIILHIFLYLCNCEMKLYISLRSQVLPWVLSPWHHWHH